MTAPRDYRDFLHDIVVVCRSVIRFVETMTFEDYLADERTRFAVSHGFEIMGEAVRHIPASIKSAHPEIPWAVMMAIRNRIAHGYFGIDDSILFATIHDDLKPLLPRLEAIARSGGVEV